MSAGEAIIIALRLAIPLLIFRNALAGGIAAMVIDGLDVVLIELIGLGGFGGHYHTLDKLLDTYYLSIEFIVALSWDNAWAKWPAVALFIYRIAGVALFELTERRVTLFIFPNMFENWWLYCVVVARYFPRALPRDARTVAIPMALLLIPKMGQEYLLHYSEAQPWDWIKRNVLRGAI